MDNNNASSSNPQAPNESALVNPFYDDDNRSEDGNQNPPNRSGTATVATVTETPARRPVSKEQNEANQPVSQPVKTTAPAPTRVASNYKPTIAASQTQKPRSASKSAEVDRLEKASDASRSKSSSKSKKKDDDKNKEDSDSDLPSFLKKHRSSRPKKSLPEPTKNYKLRNRNTITKQLDADFAYSDTKEKRSKPTSTKPGKSSRSSHDDGPSTDDSFEPDHEVEEFDEDVPGELSSEQDLYQDLSDGEAEVVAKQQSLPQSATRRTVARSTPHRSRSRSNRSRSGSRTHRSRSGSRPAKHHSYPQRSRRSSRYPDDSSDPSDDSDESSSDDDSDDDRHRRGRRRDSDDDESSDDDNRPRARRHRPRLHPRRDIVVLSEVKTPPFNGTEDPTKWIEKFRRVALQNRWNDRQMCNAAAIAFTGPAADWFSSFEAEYGRYNIDILFDQLERDYSDSDQQAVNIKKLHSERQKAEENPRDFYFRLLGLAQRCNHYINTDTFKFLYHNGLTKAIREKVTVKDSYSKKKLMRQAMRKWNDMGLSVKTEKPLVVAPVDQTAPRKPFQKLVPNAKKPDNASTAQSDETVTELKCTDGKTRTFRFKGGQPICNKCNGIGHIARFCNKTNNNNNMDSASSAAVSQASIDPKNSVPLNESKVQQ